MCASEKERLEDRKDELINEVNALVKENEERLDALDGHEALDDRVRGAIEARNV